jgi:C2 domain
MRSQLVTLLIATLLAMTGCGDESSPTSDGAFIWPDISYPDYTSGTCAPGACSGCCSSTGACVAGTDNAACGFSGNPCQVCQGTQTCKMGLCAAPPCDATSCASGCCDSSGTCQKGTEDTACGTSGQACQTCTSAEVCSNNQCGAKGPDLYKVTLVSAKITGSSWIVCGFAELSECDLYVILKVGNATSKSTIKENSNSPAWNEFMLAASESDIIKKFEVEVRDDDPIGSVQIGKCEPTITSADLAAGTHTSDCKDAKQVTWSFQKI